jgi:hypothetical protein
VLVGSVVGDEVEEQPQAALVARRDDPVEVVAAAEERVDVAVVLNVVAHVRHRGAVHRREPDGVRAEPRDVVEVGEESRQVADAIAVPVGEAARVHLVDDGQLPPCVVHDCHMTQQIRTDHPHLPRRRAAARLAAMLHSS